MTRQHGTRTKYVHDKCRCDSCIEANRIAAEISRRQRLYGVPAYIDAQPARDHVRHLGAQGMGWKRVARAAGLSPSTVWKLLYGDPKRGREPNKRIRSATADALLSVELDLAGGAKVPSQGTRRRLQALVTIGYSQTFLAGRLGMLVGNLGKTLHHNSEVLKSTAEKVAEVYDELAMTPRVASDHRTRISISRAKNYAEWMMWLPPLAWDDDTIDDPFVEPVVLEADLAIDEVAVQRAFDGDRSITLTKDERAELVRRWVAADKPLAHLERDLGIHSHRYLGATA